MEVLTYSSTMDDELIDTTEKIAEKKSTYTRINKPTGEEDEITLEDLAPDGGWGWIIALAMILIIFTTIGPTSSFAIIFGDFLEASGKAGTASSLFNSVFMITFSVSSMMTNMLLKRYSVRPVGIMAAFVFAIPAIFLAFVRNIYEMAFSYFLQGFGLGLIITICNTIFNAYFVKKRAKVMSASQVIIALSGIIFPMLAKKMMKLYGFRGTAAIIGALSLNGIVGMTLMHPVEWHARKPEEVIAERARARQEKRREYCLALLKRRSTIDVIRVSSKVKWNSLCSLKEENYKEMPLLFKNFKTSVHKVASNSAIEDEKVNWSRSKSIQGSLTKGIPTLSISSLASLTSGVSALSDIRQRHLEKKSREKHLDTDVYEKMETKKQDELEGQQKKKMQIEYKTILKELLDMSLVKNWYFMNLCFGVNFVCTADYAFSSLLPLMMTDAGYTKEDGAMTVMISGITELISKVLLTVFTMIIYVPSKYIFFGATILMEFAKIGFLLYEHTLTNAFIMTALIGIVRPWLLVPMPLVIIEDVSIQKFASAYGISAVINGLVTVVFGVLVGFIKDWTNSYKIYQISLLVMQGVFILPWALQFILVDFKKKQEQSETIKNILSTT